MTRRRLLSLALASICIIGVIFTIVPFAQALKPSAGAGATLPQIDISDLKKGSFLIHMDPMQGYFQSEYLVIHDYDEKLYVYRIPIQNKQISLPDITWMRWGGSCEKLEPDLNNDQIVANGFIRCQDKNRPDLEGNSNEWKWRYNGKNMGKYTSNMEVPKYTIEGNHVVIGKI